MTILFFEFFGTIFNLHDQLTLLDQSSLAFKFTGAVHTSQASY